LPLVDFVSLVPDLAVVVAFGVVLAVLVFKAEVLCKSKSLTESLVVLVDTLVGVLEGFEVVLGLVDTGVVPLTLLEVLSLLPTDAPLILPVRLLFLSANSFHQSAIILAIIILLSLLVGELSEGIPPNLKGTPERLKPDAPFFHGKS